jgi:hydroxymethylglutaryl-CoA lyase
MTDVTTDRTRPVVLRDVTLRDGLQDEDPIPTDAKVAIFESLVSAGVDDLEVASFVRPDRVPAMADAEAICRATDRPGLTRWGLVLNRRGAQRALDAGLTRFQYVVSVSDTHSRENAGVGTDRAIEALADVTDLAAAGGAEVEVTLSTAFGCPYEKAIDPERVVACAGQVVAAGAVAVSPADTIGVAFPSEVTALIGRLVASLDVPVGVHLHDTRGLGIVNALAALDAGARRVDGSVGGLGGCPFAPGASGNLALEDLANLLEGVGRPTGLSVDGLAEAAALACAAVGRPVSSHVGVAGTRGY